MTIPIIQSVGVPPEKYADRVVAEMLRFTVTAQTKRWNEVHRLCIETANNRADGNPAAQERLRQKIKTAGGMFFYDVYLDPGKRGKYTIHICDVCGYDPAADDHIDDQTKIPEKPWLACCVTKMHSKGRGRYDNASAITLLITHHSMSRLAQRCGAKEPKDLIIAVHAIWSRFIEVFYDKNVRKIPEGHRMRVKLPRNMGDCYVVLVQKDSDTETRVVTTILGPDGL